jgi:hypothetical protein
MGSLPKTAFLLSANGYKKFEYAQIAGELVEIIRLRGLYNDRKRWERQLATLLA